MRAAGSLNARRLARGLVGRSYVVSKRYAMLRMRDAEPPVVVFSMGKTGSTAIARVDARGDREARVPGVPLGARPARGGGAALPGAAQAGAASDGGPVAFPGALHLWESEYLLRHPPTVGRAVARDHDGAGAGRAGGLGVLPRRGRRGLPAEGASVEESLDR